MPTIITHAVVGISAGVTVSAGKAPIRFWVLSLLCVILPDADVIGFQFGIPYGHFFGHRGFFHSILFAFILGFFIASVFFKREGILSKNWCFYFLYFSLLTSTHGMLDAFTNGGLGIALLAPFDNERYFFWATPISVSPFNPKAFLSNRGINILKNELLWVWLPSLFIVFMSKIRYSHKK